MSNPGVVKLAHANVQGQKVWFDDNVGESVHFHMQDFRVDFKIPEFVRVTEELYDVVEDLIGVEGFVIRDYDAVFLEQILISKLPDLEKVVYTKVFIQDMLIPKESKNPMSKACRKLTKSRCVQALNGDDKKANVKRPSDHVNQSGKERLQGILDSIKENGYPYNNNYIVMFNDDNVIRDGQHRAACLYHLYGNIEVPVVRLYFKDNKYSIGYREPLKVTLKKIKKNKWRIRKMLENYYGKYKKVRQKIKRTFYNLTCSSKMKRSVAIFDNQRSE